MYGEVSGVLQLTLNTFCMSLLSVQLWHPRQKVLKDVIDFAQMSAACVILNDYTCLSIVTKRKPHWNTSCTNTAFLQVQHVSNYSNMFARESDCRRISNVYFAQQSMRFFSHKGQETNYFRV